MEIIMLVFTILSGVGACASCIITLYIFIRQKSIALFECRMKILRDLEYYIFYQISNWESIIDLSLFRKISHEEVTALFDDQFGNSYDEMYRIVKRINVLRGDEKFASRHDTCNGKDLEYIQNEIMNEQDKLEKCFLKEKQRIIKKIVKI